MLAAALIQKQESQISFPCKNAMRRGAHDGRDAGNGAAAGDLLCPHTVSPVAPITHR
jgi:hypothetical protein